VPARPEGTRAPSDLGGAKALPGEGRSEEAALRHGRRIHLLLEHLAGHPPAAWPARAAAILANGGEGAGDGEGAGEDLPALLAEATAVLEAPALAPLFAADTLAEVVVTAPLPALGGARIHGAIDRLVVEPGRVLAADFKTNAQVPARAEDVPEGLLRQMGAYAAALAPLYPGRRIETALVWTATASLMVLPPALTRDALARA